MQSSATGLIFLDIILYLFAVLFSYRNWKNKSFSLLLAYTAVLFFCLYAAWGGDYYHYIDYFDLIRLGFQVSVEPVYYFIIGFVNTPLQFRLIVWGGALLVFYISSNLVNINKALVLFCLVLCFLPRFSYARASLAMSILTLGNVIIGKDEKLKFTNLLVGVIILIIALNFHKSAVWGLIMISLAILFYNKMSIKTIVLLSTIAPLVIMIATLILTRISELNVGADETVLYVGQKYISGDYTTGGRGWGQIIEETLMRLSFYTVAVMFILSVKKGHYMRMPRQIKILSSTSFLTIILSSVFAFDLGFSTLVIYNRFLFFALIPSAFFIAYCMQTHFAKKWLRVVLYTGGCAALYALIYSFYCSFF